MRIQFVSPKCPDFHTLAAALDAYYFTLVGDIQYKYAEPNRPENMNALAVVYEGDTAVACGAWKAVDSQIAEIKRIYVRPEYRRRGIATALICALEESVAATGRRKLILETAVDTTSSHNLYFSLGYQLRDFYGSPAGAENCLCFHKEI